MEIVLYEPKIPQNTGNIIRLCACTNSRLSIVGKPAFNMDDASLRRAGLDYYKEISIQMFEKWEDYEEYLFKQNKSMKDVAFLSRFGKKVYTEFKFQKDQIFVFGSETKGLPEFLHKKIQKECPDNLLRIPVSKRCRSLNLANAVSIMIYEAFRQTNFPNLILTLDEIELS
ncbi:MAG: putative tRNA (cytidine(34)-2'-O)-methyltransferase [Leptospiraceae bacterium]|nr:MAG: putative tRNA (cytidine(34)-2'-O)-methyltransferase [Leptospiraceae bacterium]